MQSNVQVPGFPLNILILPNKKKMAEDDSHTWIGSCLSACLLLVCLCLHPQLHPPTHPTPCPPSLLAVGRGCDPGAVGHQQSHAAGAGHGDGHAGGAHRPGAGGVVAGVVAGVSLGGVGAHVTLELRGRLALHPAQLAQQHTAGPSPPKAPPRPAALLPLLTVVLLSVHPQVGERGEAWKTHTQTHTLAQYMYDFEIAKR